MEILYLKILVVLMMDINILSDLFQKPMLDFS